MKSSIFSSTFFDTNNIRGAFPLDNSVDLESLFASTDLIRLKPAI